MAQAAESIEARSLLVTQARLCSSHVRPRDRWKGWTHVEKVHAKLFNSSGSSPDKRHDK